MIHTVQCRDFPSCNHVLIVLILSGQWSAYDVLIGQLCLSTGHSHTDNTDQASDKLLWRHILNLTQVSNWTSHHIITNSTDDNEKLTSATFTLFTGYITLGLSNLQEPNNLCFYFWIQLMYWWINILKCKYAIVKAYPKDYYTQDLQSKMSASASEGQCINRYYIISIRTK